MQDTVVRPAERGEEAAVVATIIVAFAADPFARWVSPDPAGYLAMAPEFVPAFGGRAFDHGSADVIAGAGAVALWLPPGVQPDLERLGAVIEARVPPEVQPDLGAVLEQMEHAHPDGPLWYLPIIAVDPTHQSRGLGSVLMRHALARADADGLPAYLESSNPRNIPFYERHGFEVMDVIQSGSSPEIVPMLRRPR